MSLERATKEEPLEVLSLTPEAVRVLDQRVLPRRLRYLECKSTRQVAAAISKMAVRGAPAIGLCGAYGMALAAGRHVHRGRSRLLERLEADGAVIAASRPTAADLRAAVDRVLARVGESDPYDSAGAALAEAAEIRRELDDSCRRIASWGADLLEDVGEVLTYCNTGALATGVATGTALGAIEYAWSRTRRIEVWVPETRPYLQGSRLTAFELQRLGIPFSVTTDSACGHLISSGRVGAVMVGADRIASNGDTANKIGTYPLAVLAREHGIPFYVAAPSSTFDLSLRSGREIPIEIRRGDELLGSLWHGAAAGPPQAYYPAFDVTPAELISAFVCEYGILRPPFERSIAAAIGFGRSR